MFFNEGKSKMETSQVALAINKSYLPANNDEELKFFMDEEITKIISFQKSHPAYTKTPLVTLPRLADYLNISDLTIKDESYRFDLNAFKVLGGMYAIGKYLAKQLGKDIAELSFQELKSEEVQKQVGQLTFISATDGNHGKGVAWAARELGQKAIIYLPKGSAETRLQAIENEGAEAKVTDVNYDETVQLCAKLANENGWVMVQDTAWDGYDEIPLWIMQGYATIAKEIIDELIETEEDAPTHIFLQAGVGSFAAGIAGYFTQFYRGNAPKIIVVEPHQANCYYRSFSNQTGAMEIVTGDLDSIMAGLCCGAPNTRAFRILSQYASASVSLSDRIAALGMRVLGNPLQDDPKIVSGESGAAVATGLLYYLQKNDIKQVKKDLGLDESSRVLCINTEGDTDEIHYRDIVWGGKYSL